MNTIQIDKKHCKMIAHRGVCGLEKENTCAAFVAAGVKTYYGIETDVHVTADGQYFVFHDDNMKRIAGVDIDIEKSTAEEIRAVRMPDTDGKTIRSDLVVPELKDYIAVCKKYGKIAVLELKNEMEKRHVLNIASIVAEMGWLEHTTFISFSANNLVALREEYPEVSVQFLTCEITEENFELMKRYRFGADLMCTVVTREFVERMHAEGLEVNCWTVNLPEDAAKLIDMGVDYITSNILE